MDKEQGHAAKIRLVTLMRQGQPWQVAAATAGVQTSQSTAYRLLQVYHSRGEVALQDGRHGHPSKLRGEARTFLADYCRGAPHTASSVIQTLLQERFDLSVSVSQINRIRAALGVSNSSHARQQEKKGSKRSSYTSRRVAGRCWQSPVTRRRPSNWPTYIPGNSPLSEPTHR